MIATVLRISVLRLWNNQQELLLTLLVPILFFSIFALIFGQGIASDTPAIKIAVVNDDGSQLTDEIVRLVREQPALRVESDVFVTNDQWPIEPLAKAIIHERNSDVVVYLPRGLQQNVDHQESVIIRLFHEGSNPVARQIVDTMLSQLIRGTVQKRLQSTLMAATGAAIPTAFRSQIHQQSAAPAAQSARRVPATDDPQVQAADHRPNRIPVSRSEKGAVGELVILENSSVFAISKHNPKIAMYAAGIAVMFLLFSATGAGGSLLEEDEAGTLDRLLTSRLSITELLIGKWLYIAGLGCVQLTVMFVWAQVAFGVDLWGHLHGFAVMTLFTAAATASLALCLAVLCRSRTQLNGVSIVLILTMSALGGSMVPRYIMSERMQRWGQWTFNAWALDGFKKVFWLDLPPPALQDEVRVLLFMTVLLACLARVFASRWSTD